MNKFDKYAQTIKELGQVICSDKHLADDTKLSLLYLMSQCGDVAIKALVGDQYEQVIEILQHAL